MTYSRFEDLPVWQDAMHLAQLAEDFLEAAGPRISRGKADQLDRCSLSVSNNIAEGFERGSTNELLQFLYIARGSAGEVRSMMRFFHPRPKLTDLKPQIADIGKLAESCGRQIRAWADSLQNSDIKGQRHLNDKSRTSYEKQQLEKAEKDQFYKMMLGYYLRLPNGHPSKEEARRKGLIGPGD
jgi:four helix bundle protein